MDLQGSDFSDSRDSMIIFSESRDPNRVPKTPWKKQRRYWNRITRFDSGRILRFSFGPGTGVKNLWKTGPGSGVTFPFRQ